MLVKIVDRDGNPPEKAVEKVLEDVLKKLRNSGPIIREGLLWTTRNHFQEIYPGSAHYAPDKVQPLDASSGDSPEGSIEIDVPGITRAYHDMNIYPKFREWLTIPIHRSAYGKKASDFTGLFKVTKKDGRSFLVRKDGAGQLVFLFRLMKHVFQRQDERLMPTEENYGDNIARRIFAYIDRTATKV